MSGVLSFERKGDGFVVKLIDELGRSEVFARDLAGRMTARTDADGGTWTYTYDCCDLIATTDPLGVTTTRSHDPLHRLVSQFTAPDVQVNFGWNRGGGKTWRALRLLCQAAIEYPANADAGYLVLGETEDSLK